MNKEIAIIDASTGSVEIHTLPHHVHNSQDELEDYLTLTLEVTSDQQWIAADHIIFTDYRTKTAAP